MPLYQLHHPGAHPAPTPHSCPIAATFGLDERGVRAGLHEAEAYAALLHDGMTIGVEAQQVQADKIQVRVSGGAVWAVVAFDMGCRL